MQTKLIPDPKQVAVKYGVKPEQVTHYKVFRHVFLVKIQGLGCRFVSFKMAMKSAPMPKIKPAKPVLRANKFQAGLVYRILRTHKNPTSSYMGQRLIRVLGEDIATGEKDWFSTWKTDNAQVGELWRQSSDPQALVRLSRDKDLQEQVLAMGIK
ncbi:hypothetical protein I4641_09475 [Waterburya agarophytonicola K14]|uniref:Uncharacterized protein n=1 Tax=Waterburya agarophytonicola KI4 TaxID=2874699 RepID=A0A964FFQ3_9CYAN|nr:hypothetical protein [Waterburya agarophytonicola]MCC0177206.1 hypothetical protein [Waterburya agarophytonicola KI4]